MSGAAETISPSNETKVRASWRAIAEAVAREAERGAGRCDELLQQWEKEFKEGSGDEEGEEEEEEEEGLLASLRMVRTVWTEEERIARAVLAAPQTTS